MDSLIFFSLWLAFSYMLALFVNRLGIPRISTYLVMGMLISPDFIGKFIPTNFNGQLDNITKFLLAIIAFLVGADFDLVAAKEHGKNILFGTIGQIAGACVLTSLTLYYVLPDSSYIVPLSIFMGVIASTTAPAATISIIEEYGAKGPLTNSLLGIVILDDLFGVFLFSFAVSFLGPLDSNGIVFDALYKITGSIGVGVIIGSLLGLFYRYIDKDELRFPFFISLIMLAHFLSLKIFKSSILSCMMIGLFAKFFVKGSSQRLISPVKNIEEFIFIVFFLLAGIHFKIEIFKEFWPFILVYVGTRAIGKYLGSYIGLSFNGSDHQVRSLIGLGLLPQAGVAIGLALSLATYPQFEEFASLILNIILGGTLIYELIGPILTKYALKKAAEF